MTNAQLYFAIGVPCFTILTALIVNILTVLGMRGDIRELRLDVREIRADMKTLRSELTGEMNGLRGEMNSLRGELNTKMDMLLAKFYEHDTDIARLKDKAGLQ